MSSEGSSQLTGIDWRTSARDRMGFEETFWTVKPRLAREARKQRASRWIRVRSPSIVKPVRLHAREGDVVDRRNRDRICEFVNGESEKSTRARGGRDCELNGMVESPSHYGNAGL